MPWNGSGDVSLTQNFSADRDAGLPTSLISADKVMDVLNDLASVIEDCINRSGENAVADDIDWGGNLITNYGAASAGTHVPRARQVAENTVQYGGTTGGSANAHTVTNSFITTVATGTRLLCFAGFTNTAAATLNVNSGGAVSIKRLDGSALIAGDIKASRFFEVVYDGTNWVLGFGVPLNYIDQRTAVGDTAYTVLSTDRVVATSAVLTAPRIWTLPAATAPQAGQIMVLADEAGGVTGSNTLTVAAAGSDTINGVASIILATAYAGVMIIPNGTSKWLAIPFATSGAADKFAYFSAANKIELASLTSFGRSVIDDADAAAARTTLGATTIGSTVFTAADAAAIRTAIGLAAIAASGSASDLSAGTVATARLGSGSASSSTFLRGDQTWAALPTIGWTLIQSQAISSAVAQIDFTTSVSSYKQLYLVIDQLRPASTGSIQVQLSIDGNSTFVTARYLRLNSGASVANADSNIIGSGQLIATGENAAVALALMNTGFANSQFDFFTAIAGSSKAVCNGYLEVGSSPINGIRIKFDSGNIAGNSLTATCKLYGLP